MRADRHKYSFIKKEYAKGGRVAAALAVVSFVLFIAAVVLSFARQGQAGVMAGGLVLLSFLFSAYGFFAGMRSFSEKGVSTRLSVIGSIASGVQMGIYLTLYLTGIKGL